MDDDGELVKRMQKGDLRAFDELFERHRRSLFAYVRQMVWDQQQAEDIVQESFVKMVEARGKLDPEFGVRGWLFRVARNRAVDYLRQRRRLTAAAGLPEPVDAAGKTPAGELVQREDRVAVRQALRELPAKERDVLELRYYGGLTFQEIADVLEQPLGTVLWRARKTLKDLRRVLAAKEDHR